MTFDTDTPFTDETVSRPFCCAAVFMFAFFLLLFFLREIDRPVITWRRLKQDAPTIGFDVRPGSIFFSFSF